MAEILSLKETTVTIDRLSKKAKGIVSTQKIEVPYALSQEEVLVHLKKGRRGKKEGTLLSILRPSPDRIEPRCSHFTVCGGCSVQHLAYRAQLTLKETEINTLFSSFNPQFLPIIPCADPWQYRNKMEFSFSQNKAGDKFLGLMQQAGRGKVVNLSECHLVSKWFMDALSATRAFWEKSKSLAYHPFTNTGHLRTLTLREAKRGSGKMAILTVSGDPKYAFKREDMHAFTQALLETVEEKESLSIFIRVQQLAKGRPTQFFEMLLHGPDHITEQLHIEIEGKAISLLFKISPTSFFQPHTLQAEKLYSAAFQMLESLPHSSVLDLYCGGGGLGLCAAFFAKEVVGIELNPHSVFDALWNKQVNKIENFSIHQGDVASTLKKLQQEGRPLQRDIVIVDPARSGLDKEALLQIKTLYPKEILYISCNPMTQKENIEELTAFGYRLCKVQPVDQFPHTLHIENICYLCRM